MAQNTAPKFAYLYPAPHFHRNWTVEAAKHALSMRTPQGKPHISFVQANAYWEEAATWKPDYPAAKGSLGPPGRWEKLIEALEKNHRFGLVHVFL
jgi:hypothetical protein